MHDLIAMLEDVITEGSRELDYDIYAAIDPRHGTLARRDGWGTNLVSAYSTSLDAALPGEDIYMVLRRFDDWVAFDARGTVGISKTEPLARRIAAMKAIAAG